LSFPEPSRGPVLRSSPSPHSRKEPNSPEPLITMPESQPSGGNLEAGGGSWLGGVPRPRVSYPSSGHRESVQVNEDAVELDEIDINPWTAALLRDIDNFQYPGFEEE